MSNSTGSKEIPEDVQKWIKDNNNLIGDYWERPVVRLITSHEGYKMGAEAMYLKLQEEKPKGELKQFGPEDTEELVKGVKRILDEVLAIGYDPHGQLAVLGKKMASERIGFAHAAMLDAVYEGAAEWESDCKDAQSQVSALRSENERLKGERDSLKKSIEDRISYLIKVEAKAISDLDNISIALPQRAVQWNFVNELGHRKNELQDILKQYPNQTT